MDSIIGKTLGKYQVQQLIGRGAMAEVYKAYHPALDRHVAIKLLHSFLAEDKNFLVRFQREAKSAAQLRHPNIVQTYDFDETDGVYYYIVMEYIDGNTLEAKLHELATHGTIMPLGEAIRIAGDVASALSYAHNHGMIHRDIKPSNVMLNRESHVILTDFGIAKIITESQHTSTGTVGTPNYISPEQGLGKGATARSDIYSLGAMFFQMVTGQLPYQADMAVAVLLKHVNDPVPVASMINPALPPDVDTVISRAMAKNPDDRHRTADEFIEHLKQIEAGPPSTLSEPVMLSDVAAMESVESTTLFLPSSSPSLSPVAALSGAVNLQPYTLSLNLAATDPSHLPAVCDADWSRAVDHFYKGYMTEWLRDGVKELRASHQHGLADELELIMARAEAIHRRAGDDEILRNAGLDEFLQSLGAAPPLLDVFPQKLDLPTVGVGRNTSPVTLTITNKGRGYLCGSITCRAPWLKAKNERFGCAAGNRTTIEIEPDLSGLPAGRVQSAEGVEIHSTGGDCVLAVQVNILPSGLQVDVPVLDFGAVGQGEAAQTSFAISNKGKGFLMGRVRCRVPWLAAEPEHFKVLARESVRIAVSADSQALPPGHATHNWALMVESNGGHAVLGVQIQVLSPRLEVDPSQIDLGTIDLIRPGAGKKAKLTVCNSGPGILTGAVMTEPTWLTIEPSAFRCRTGETQHLQLSTVKTVPGDYFQALQLVSNAGVAEIPVQLKVRFALEPEMVHVPAGSFLRGSQEGDQAAAQSEKPQRSIHLSEYWIGKYPVTNAQYAAFVDATGHRAPDHWKGDHVPEEKENHPVVNVSWWDALAYCRWLSDITGKSYRLPTEAQWEKAARGPEGQMYPWGNRWDSRVCNTHESGKKGTTPVGSFSPTGDSPYGSADMVGNVLEWVADWYKDDYYARSSVTQDPYGPASGPSKVLRGGSWSSSRTDARCTTRLASSQKTTNSEVGFRCAMSVAPHKQDADGPYPPRDGSE
jgi:formylglycine-generating enzyme required for sulfatase activity/serine/threonine protein kinase